MILKGKYKYQPTSKEMEVLRRLYKTEKEIALDIGISHHTIHSRVLRLLEKLDVKTKAEAVIMALKLGYVSLEEFDC